jgi:DNA integrity scanning protein DisA with diadenylate cyclase activity
MSSTQNEILLAELGINEIKYTIPKLARGDVGLSELWKLLRPSAHEGRIVPYGFIFVKNKALLTENIDKGALISNRKISLDTARRLADGVQTFTVFGREGRFYGLLCLKRALLLEPDQIKFASKLQGILSRVDALGKVEMFVEQGIITCQGRRWFFKRSIDNIIESVNQCVPQANTLRLRHILHFCYHELSPFNIGSTIIWYLKKLTDLEIVRIAPQLDLRLFNLSLDIKEHATALKHLLSNSDGALIIDEESKAIGAAAHLKYSKISEEMIEAMEGTRHTSARRFTYDSVNAVAFVVSSDGAVSVFSDGAKVGELAIRPAERSAASLSKVAPDKRGDVYSSSHRVKCGKCGKTSIIEEVVILGWKDREEVHCDVCGKEIYSSMCFHLGSHVMKVF